MNPWLGYLLKPSLSWESRKGAAMARGKRAKSKLREYLEIIVVSLLLAMLIRTYIICGYRVPSGSMEDTLLVGDNFLACRFLYRFTDPKPGDVIVFQYPLDESRDFVKRVVAVEGQTVEIRDKMVLVDGAPVPMPAEGKHIDTRNYSGAMSTRDNYGPTRVPPDHVFVMGDNRDNSHDSRYWGFLNRRFIKGKALVLDWSWKRLPGDPELADLKEPIIESIPRLCFSFFNVFVFEISRIPWRVRWNRIGRLIRA
jgi:signal peptidase I